MSPVSHNERSRRYGPARGVQEDCCDPMKLPQPVPELPVNDVQAASDAYARQMGFNLDWVYEDSFAGISKDAARLFLRRRNAQEARERYSVTIWLNMESSAAVDELYFAWKVGGVAIAVDLETTPYRLREFTAQDVDGNRLRVFYDLGSTGS